MKPSALPATARVARRPLHGQVAFWISTAIRLSEASGRIPEQRAQGRSNYFLLFLPAKDFVVNRKRLVRAGPISRVAEGAFRVRLEP
jgi:hypothetical protein